LLLPARELARLAFAVPTELDELEDLFDLPPELAATRPLASKPKGDVFEDREVREQGVALKDGVDVPLVGRRPADLAVA